MHSKPVIAPLRFQNWRQCTGERYLHWTSDSNGTRARPRHASLAILSVFAVEQLLLLVAEGGRFFRNPYYLLDLGVISLSRAGRAENAVADVRKSICH